LEEKINRLALAAADGNHTGNFGQKSDFERAKDAAATAKDVASG
jgi:hypothetical protein